VAASEPGLSSQHARKQSRSLSAEYTNEIGANRNRAPSPDIPAEPGWPQIEWQDFTVVSPSALLHRLPCAAGQQDQVIRLRQTAVRRTEAELAYLSRYTHRVDIANTVSSVRLQI
jgi:hypothetical protein